MRHATSTLVVSLLLCVPAAAQHHGRYGETATAGAYSPCQYRQDPDKDDPFDVKPADNLDFHVTARRQSRSS